MHINALQPSVHSPLSGSSTNNLWICDFFLLSHRYLSSWGCLFFLFCSILCKKGKLAFQECLKRWQAMGNLSCLHTYLLVVLTYYPGLFSCPPDKRSKNEVFPIRGLEFARAEVWWIELCFSTNILERMNTHLSLTSMFWWSPSSIGTQWESWLTWKKEEEAICRKHNTDEMLFTNFSVFFFFFS